MFPFNMVERMWYVLLCLISNSQLLLPIHSLSLRDASGIQARVVGNSNGSTVHIVLQRSTADTVAEKVCPPGFYEHTRPRRRTGRAAAATIVGRSGTRSSSNGGSSKVPNENEEEEIVPLKLCLPCSLCKEDQITKKSCTPTKDTVCQTCGINVDSGPCVRYEQVDINLATNPPRNDKASNVQVTLDFAGKPDVVKADKTGLGSAPQDLNVNILKAGKDERNSWYFLSLCALIGLLVFLSLVMGAYLVSVKVTSWWRYQRPVTVRRRGQSFHSEGNHINLTTFPSSSQHYDDIIPGSREVTRSREVAPREAIKLVRGPEAASVEESYPSTSASSSAPNPKIQVVHLRAGSSDFDSMASFDSYVMDGRGFSKARYVDRYYTAGCSWSGNATNRDSSDYSSDDDGDEDDDCGGAESGAIFSPSRQPAVPRTVRGKHLYQSLPLSESGSGNDGSCKVHIVQWPSAVRTGHRSTFQVCMNGENSEYYHGTPTQRSADDLHRGYPSVKHKTSVSENLNCNTFPKNYHPLMNLNIEKNYDPHSVCTTQVMTGAISLDSSSHCPMGSTPLKLDHHSQSLRENSDPSYKQSTAALPVAGGRKYDHQLNHPPQRTEWDDRGSGYQSCQNFHEHRSKSDKSHSYPPNCSAVVSSETTEPHNGTEAPILNGNCEPHPPLEEGINRHDDDINEATTSCTNHNTADAPLGAQLCTKCGEKIS